MRILVANHTGSVSGAERALLRLLATLSTEHDIAVACPADGDLPSALDGAGIPRLTIPAFEASFRPDPIDTPLGLARLGASGAILRALSRRTRADVLYANTTRAGLMGMVARRLGGPPMVVRVHDQLPYSPAGRAVRSLLARSATGILAVSDYTARCFNDGLRNPLATRVYNSIDHVRFDPARLTPAPLREQLRIDTSSMLLGQVAQITQWKRQDHAIRVLSELRRRDVRADLVLVGDVVFAGKRVRYDNPAYLRRLHRLVDELRLAGTVHFLGHRDDVPEILGALDLSFVPSREEPFGLVAIESMAMGTPVLVADGGGVSEVVQDGVSGRVLPAERPEEWALAAIATMADRNTLAEMGASARSLAAEFDDETHGREILARLNRAASSPHPACRH